MSAASSRWTKNKHKKPSNFAQNIESKEDIFFELYIPCDDQIILEIAELLKMIVLTLADHTLNNFCFCVVATGVPRCVHLFRESV